MIKYIERIKEIFMRKFVFFSIALSISVLCFGAFAANERGRARTQNTTNQNTANAPVAARAATRGAVKTAATQNVGGNVSARAATKQTNAGSGVVSARAGSVQKVINTGTKVATATTNTNVPQECQEGFFGCMDAFCMLDNASGGRCQCSDRIVELDKALEDILKLDEQTYLMATEGVERIQMGEGEEQIMARAKAAADKITTQDKEDNKKKVRTLDLSAWDNNIFNDVDDLFESNSGDNLNTFADKQGDDLYKASAKMCAAQTSDKCKEYGSMMQLIYAQRIKSDCIAYENSLKAQKSQSQQKLQAAQKALRDAALDEYQNQNKYATTGECVIAFTRCMQTTAECGEDYTGCVTLAAQENVKGNKSGANAKQTTIKSSVAGADITLAATTMDQLLAKKLICESVTKQCVNSNRNDAVWNAFLRNAAPALKSAELIAEQNLRSNCIPAAAECFKNACKSQFGENDESYDMCLSDPLTYKSLCKVQLEPCLEATGGTYDDPTTSTLWNGLVAMLNSMKVDACTKEIKTCLTERCGDDFAGCVGLDTESIGKLCPAEKLTACVADGKYVKRNSDGTIDDTEVRTYIAEIAQGLALQIDNSLATVCQNAAKQAMIKLCGDSETCESVKIDLSSLASLMKVQACQYKTPDGVSTDTQQQGMVCMADVSQFADDQIYAFEYEVKLNDNKTEVVSVNKKKRTVAGDLSGYGVYATLVGRPEVSAISYDGKDFVIAGTKVVDGSVVAGTVSGAFDKANTERIITILNGAVDRIVNSIESDPTVTYCMTGREVRGFNSSKIGGKAGSTAESKKHARFPELTSGVRGIIAEAALGKLMEENAALVEPFEKSLAEMSDKIAQRESAIAAERGAKQEAVVDAVNMQKCGCDKNTEGAYCLSSVDPNRRRKDGAAFVNGAYVARTKKVTDIKGSYDAAKNICTLKTIESKCKNWLSPRCYRLDDGTVLNTTTVQMPKIN